MRTLLLAGGSLAIGLVVVMLLGLGALGAPAHDMQLLALMLGLSGSASLALGLGGFSLAQLEALDFSRMDLAEFYAEIAPTLPETGAMRARVQQKVESYYKP